MTIAPLPDQAALQEFFASIGEGMADFGSAGCRRALQPFFKQVGKLLSRAEVEQLDLDRKLATRFNVFSLIDPDENTLSKIVADLLEPDGDHGQGPLFLNLFLARLGIDPATRPSEVATIRREASTHTIENFRRRMDVLIEAGTLVAIENKVDAQEQENQVTDYLDHLERMGGSTRRAILIYLTPNGRAPQSVSREREQRLQASGALRCWSYQTELRAWLEQCCQQCQANRIRDFLTDFIRYIQSSMRRNPESQTEGDPDEH
jgi:hypothetical protein